MTFDPPKGHCHCLEHLDDEAQKHWVRLDKINSILITRVFVYGWSQQKHTGAMYPAPKHVFKPLKQKASEGTMREESDLFTAVVVCYLRDKAPGQACDRPQTHEGDGHTAFWITGKAARVLIRS